MLGTFVWNNKVCTYFLPSTPTNYTLKCVCLAPERLNYSIALWNDLESLPCARASHISCLTRSGVSVMASKTNTISNWNTCTWGAEMALRHERRACANSGWFTFVIWLRWVSSVRTPELWAARKCSGRRHGKCYIDQTDQCVVLLTRIYILYR